MVVEFPQPLAAGRDFVFPDDDDVEVCLFGVPIHQRSLAVAEVDIALKVEDRQDLASKDVEGAVEWPHRQEHPEPRTACTTRNHPRE